jgi:hypothetical protein
VTTTLPPIKHGAAGSGGAQAHRRRHEEPCADCLRAERQYIADYRRRFPDRYARMLEHKNARDRAMVRLAKNHEHELDALTADELKRGPQP